MVTDRAAGVFFNLPKVVAVSVRNSFYFPQEMYLSRTNCITDLLTHTLMTSQRVQITVIVLAVKVKL